VVGIGQAPPSAGPSRGDILFRDSLDHNAPTRKGRALETLTRQADRTIPAVGGRKMTVESKESGRFDAWLLMVILAAAAAVAVFLAALYFSDAAQKELGPALMSGALEIAFVGVLGGLLTGQIKNQLDRQQNERKAQLEREAERARDQRAFIERTRRLNEYRLRLLLDLVSAYHQVKAARRALRAAGFSRVRDGTLTPWQIAEYHRQIAGINGAQLQFQKLYRELGVDVGALSNLNKIRADVEHAKDYLDTILDGWEESGAAVSEGSVEAVRAQSALAEFLMHEGAGGAFKQGVSVEIEDVEEWIREDIRRSNQAAALDPARPLGSAGDPTDAPTAGWGAT
jgi:hypothetical protein